MKKKIYKVLGIVLTMAIVLSACLCAMTAAHAETAVTLVQGTIDNGAIKDGAANRAYTKDLISLYENVSVKIASGYKAAYHLYDYQGNWIKYIGSWQEGTMKTMSLSNYDTKAFYFRIVIGASASNASGDNANFKVADLPADVITFEANPQDTVNGFVITPALVSGTVSGRANTNLNSSVQTHATRMYPINIYEVAEIESLTVADGHRVYVHYYGADGVWVGQSNGWQTGTYKIACEGAKYFRVTYDTASGSGNPAVDGLTLKMYAKDVTEDGATTPVTIQGNIISAQGGKIQTTSTNRIYTKNEYAVADYEKVTIADGYRMVVHFWDANGAYLGETGWQTGTKTLKSLPNGANATYFRVVAGDSANSDPFKPDDFPFGTLKLVLAPKDVLKDFVISPALVSGTINGAPYNVNTCFGTHATRLATYNTYKVADVYKIDVAEGCRVFVQFFKADGSYNDGSGWQTKGTYLVSKLKGATGATYFRITFDSADGSTTPPADGLKFYAISEQKVDGNVLYPAMAKGTVNGAANLTIDTCVADNAIRLHTYNVLKVADIESITVPANCRAFIHFFNEDGSYNGPQGWIQTGTQKLSNMGPVKNGATQFKVTFDSADGGSTPSVEGFYFTLHEYDNACDGTCNNCDVTRVPADHVYENYTSNNDATCTQNATETGTCSCGATDTREVADSKLDHVYENYTSNGDATCTADGTKTGTCACGATDTIADEGSMLDHTYENYTSNGDATCTADGTKTGTCVCGATDTIADVGSMLDHTYENYTSNGDATCTADGTKTGTCVCGATDTIADEGSMLDHTYENYTYNEDATCTANGTETGTCACGATDTREAAETKLGHKFVNYVSDGNATCTADGTKTAKCERCEETDTIADDGSMLDHTYENYTYNEDATCTANGTETGTCACGATNTREAAGTMLAHTFENYTSNDDATCEEDGTKTGTCVCGATDVIVDEGTAFGHTWKRPTCTDPKTCATCGATVGEAFGHDYDTNYDKDCNVCGDVREAEAITDIEIRDGKVYVNGKTSIKGLFCVDGEYYFADWGGVIKTGGKFYVKTSYCDLEGGKEYLFGEDGKMVHEEIIDGILYIHGRTASKGIYKIDGEYYFSNWGGKIEGGLKTTGYVENCDLPAGTYRFDENGKMLDNALYIDENGVKYIYVKGKTCVPGLYKIDGTLYAATWGGVVRTDGRFFVKNSFCDEEANGYFYCDADGVAEAI